VGKYLKKHYGCAQYYGTGQILTAIRKKHIVNPYGYYAFCVFQPINRSKTHGTQGALLSEEAYKTLHEEIAHTYFRGYMGFKIREFQ